MPITIGYELLAMKCLVTGGAGFIGSHVVDALLESGHKVRILDNLTPPTHDGTLPSWVSREAEFVLGDVRKKEDWKKALKDVDAVIHLAAYMDFHLDFSKYITTNIESVALLYECIVEQNLPIKKIIASSSQSVYGEGKYKCIDHGVQYLTGRTEDQLSKRDWEQHCPKCGNEAVPVAELENDKLQPEIPYAISKRASEDLLKTLGKRYGIPSVSLRYSIVLGPRQSFRHYYSGALRAFAVNVLNNEPIQMNEDGMQIRDFVHVKDVADAHVKVLEDGRANFEEFNVGSGKETRVIDLAKTVSESAGVEFNPIINNRYRIGGARHSLMNIEKLKMLGWEPKHSLDQMVKDYLDWVKQFEDLSSILKNTEDKMKNAGLIKEV